jgi:hypothetical protein
VGEKALDVSLLGSWRHDRHDARIKRLIADFGNGLSNGGCKSP